MLKSVKWICIFYWKSNFITFAFELIEWELKKKSKKKNKRRNTNIQHTYTHTKQNSNRDETPIDREEIFIHLILNWFFLSFWISSKSHTRIKHTAFCFVVVYWFCAHDSIEPIFIGYSSPIPQQSETARFGHEKNKTPTNPFFFFSNNHSFCTATKQSKCETWRIKQRLKT